MQPTLVLAFFALFAAVCSALPAFSKRDPSYTIQLNSETAFCSFLPPNTGDDVGSTENDGKPFCTDDSLGGEAFPTGFIQTAHFASTDDYVQVTGTIDRSKYSLSSSDGGGQYDNKDIDGVVCNGYKYWVNMLEPDANTFCIRCCKNQSDCNLGLSTYGCERVVPGDYS
ncbi:uncharacterized protein B0P05DRAFT_526627 [Gilbertella persicaria]|uniref:Uncharacterized protein n=1 Tax=Rhizopus stolonifer TaxID=4846 RepID=A0A367KSC5_RHIST|nr:uncharacterized protein B0P05DRAFT_526624 [Gilbertella persicaria]XP_051438322.1 uncharacterized protein B0P05DRAFT_526627 [Gilbertella persicaria]RCH96398.1 hypothetical protein CU098_010140 [Rhizopus stolonifer]KAI8091225.1 hypothetical protein B0P05DRAFT_526624 [Gilbertella persicaria]KAI8091226.1 hypothetical protein B0P05DRAFT_526627 [Gilbertella persicaria]RCI05091.1 hypothetical protein CU098_013181 [Rhizopus stolonifer]